MQGARGPAVLGGVRLGVRLVRCFLLQNWCLLLCCNLQSCSTVLPCALLCMRAGGHQSSQSEALLVKALRNITSTLKECFLWKNNTFVLLSVHLGNLQHGSKSFSATCWSASTQISKFTGLCRRNLLKKSLALYTARWKQLAKLPKVVSRQQAGELPGLPKEPYSSQQI